MSPTTTSRPGMRCSTPSRITSARGLDRSLQAGEGVLGAPLLQDRDQQDDDNRRGQHDGLAQVAEHDVDRRGGDQQQEHRLRQHLPGDAGEAPWSVAGKLVRTILRQ